MKNRADILCSLQGYFFVYTGPKRSEKRSLKRDLVGYSGNDDYL